MAARNGKSMMKLVRLPIFSLMLPKHEILCKFTSLKNLKDLYGRVARLAKAWQGLPPNHTNPFYSFLI